MSDTKTSIVLEDLSYRWPKAKEDTLSHLDLRVERGERLFLYGPSGSGKTTLLGLVTGVLTASSGRVEILGQDLFGLSTAARDTFRGRHIGYIFQMFNLIPYLSVIENVTLPCRLHPSRRSGDESLETSAASILSQLGLGDPALLFKPVTELSVGQQQRVAAARALIGSPELIVADEPTSSLDSDNREQFLELLFASAAQSETTILFVSHDRSLQHLFDRSIALTDLCREVA